MSLADLCNRTEKALTEIDRLLRALYPTAMACSCATDTMHANQDHPQTTATAQDRRTPGSQPAPSPVAPAAAAPVFGVAPHAAVADLTGAMGICADLDGEE